MRYKPDWPDARERLAALWDGRPLDRPCIAITAPSGANEPVPPPTSFEQRWTDPEWNARAALAAMRNTWWGGEAVPSYLLMCGWLVCFGGRTSYAETTIWHDHRAMDFSRPPAFAFDPADPQVRIFERAYLALADAAGYDDFLVGSPCILPANDLFSMQMETDAFLLALLDHPQWMREAVVQGARAQLAAGEHFRRLIAGRHQFWYGIAGWMPFWAPRPFLSTQSDVSCMLSPAAFDEFILPELDVYGEAYGALWYHLDGGDARQHLPRLLSLPYTRMIQYTPAPCEPPNGPEHLAFYRRVQAAGRIVHIEVPVENVEPLVESLDPRLLMLKTHCGSIDEGEELLRAAKRWMAKQ